MGIFNLVRALKATYWIGPISILLGIVVIIGWIFEIQILKTVVPGYMSMKVNTALFFIMSGIAVTLIGKKKAKRTVFVISLLLIGLSFASLLQNIWGTNFGIDQIFIIDNVAIKNGDMYPGRPSPVTSFSFGLFGLVFIFAGSSKPVSRRIAQYMLHTISLLTFIAIIGYLFKVPSFYKLSFFTSMAIHTSLGLFLLSITVTLFNPAIGITKLFTGEQVGNVMARNVLKRVLPAILVLGFVQIELSRRQMLSNDFGIALFSSFFVIIILYALWSTSKLLNKIDDNWQAAENKIYNTNKNLEKTVEERTSHLTRQNQQLEDFSYIISHNLRGPMGNLKSLVLLYKTETTIEGKDELMAFFDKSICNISSTLDDLLEVVTIRNESKKDKVRLNFEEIFTKLIENHKGEMIKQKARITSDFSEAPFVEYSPMYLESIMQNLLSNALKYSSKERLPEIHFKTKKIEDKIELSIRDNGLGIDLKKHGRSLFGLRKTFHEHPEAKGVGLFMTKSQIESMGGAIAVKSEKGKGTTFEVLFQ